MPLTFQDFKLSSIQAVVFTPGGQVSTPRLLVTLLEEWGDLFDGEPFSFPVMDGPPEFPRIILESKDEEFKLQVAGNSAVFSWNYQQTKPDYSLEKFITIAHKVLTFFLDSAPAKAGRLTLNVRRQAANPQPADALIRHFCQPKWLEGPLRREDNFELHAHKVYQMRPEFRVNSWVRCKTTQIADQDAGEESPGSHPAILVDQDINTLGEVAAEVQFSAEDILLFLKAASEEVDHIVAMYFPKD